MDCSATERQLECLGGPPLIELPCRGRRRRGPCRGRRRRGGRGRRRRARGRSEGEGRVGEGRGEGRVGGHRLVLQRLQFLRFAGREGRLVVCGGVPVAAVVLLSEGRERHRLRETRAVVHEREGRPPPRRVALSPFTGSRGRGRGGRRGSGASRRFRLVATVLVLLLRIYSSLILIL